MMHLKCENETRFENDASKNLKTKELMLENVVSKTNKACIQNLKTKHPRPQAKHLQTVENETPKAPRQNNYKLWKTKHPRRQDKTTINCGKQNTQGAKTKQL